jgi:hypothetical protein
MGDCKVTIVTCQSAFERRDNVFAGVIGSAVGLTATQHPVGIVVGGAIGPVVAEAGSRLTASLLSRGAIDLAHRLKPELVRVERSAKELKRLLGPSEKTAINL